MCQVGGHISLRIAPQLTCKHVCIIVNVTERKQNFASSSAWVKFHCVRVCELLCRRVIQHMCVIATPHLSSPTASPGWKRVKPQTSGAPQPIRTVYSASGGGRAEHECTASHTGLHWSLCTLSFSTASNSSGCPTTLLALPFILQPLFPRQSDRTLPGRGRWSFVCLPSKQLLPLFLSLCAPALSLCPPTALIFTLW